MSDLKESLSNEHYSDEDYSDSDSFSDNYEEKFNKSEIVKSRIYDILNIRWASTCEKFKHNTSKKLNLYYSENGDYIEQFLEHNELIIKLISSNNITATYEIPLGGLRYIDLQPFVGSFCHSDHFSIKSLNIAIDNDQSVINVIILLE